MLFFDCTTQCQESIVAATIMLATTNQCFRTNTVIDEYITELAACLMQEPNVPM